MSNSLEKLRKENNSNDKLLTKENDRIMTDMVVYLRSSKLCDYDIEIIRRELFGMIYEAQIRLEPISQVIGTDYKEFCNQLMENGRQKSTYERILEWAYIGVVGAGVLFLIEVFFTGYIFDLMKNRQWNMPITTGFVLSAFVILGAALAVYWFFTKYSFELSGTGSFRYQMGFIVGFTALFVGIGMIKYLLGDQDLFRVNVAFPIILLGASYLLVKILGDKYADQMSETHR